MKFASFTGGIHPNDRKEMSKYIPIKEVIPNGELVYQYHST